VILCLCLPSAKVASVSSCLAINIFFFFMVAVGFELRASHLLRQAFLPLELLHQPFFVILFFSRQGLRNYLPGASFKLRFSWSLPASWVARITGMSHHSSTHFWGWRASSSRVPLMQAWSTEFKLQSHQNKRNPQKRINTFWMLTMCQYYPMLEDLGFLLEKLFSEI
jgi:hypothetical protein